MHNAIFPITSPAKKEPPLRWSLHGGMHVNDGSTTPIVKDQEYPRHELLGSRVLDGSEADFCWKNVIDIGETPWLAEHVLLDQIVFPAAAYIALAGESLQQLSEGNLKSYIVTDILITSALILKRDQKSQLRTTVRPIEITSETGQWYAITIASFADSDWTEHCVGKISPRDASSSGESGISLARSEPSRHVPQAYWYDVLENAGLRYGPAFQGLTEISTALRDHDALATVSSFRGTAKYILHPVAIEQCLQIIQVAACKGQGRSITRLPVVTAIERLVVSGGVQAKSNVQGTAFNISSDYVLGNASAFSDIGRTILSIKGCKISQVPRHNPGQEDKLLSFVAWDTDTTFCDLNQAFAGAHSKPESLKITEILKLVAYKNPNLSILELGNGADEMMNLVLDSLKSSCGERLYLNYTYAATSLDAAFRLRAALQGVIGVNVEFYDIHDLQSSNLRMGTYDIIITTDSISMARQGSKAYTDSLKQLIHPSGYLFLFDTIPESIASEDRTILSQMHKNLLESGFVFNLGNEHSSDSTKVVAQLKKAFRHPNKVSLVVTEDHHALVDVVENTLLNSGINSERCTFEGNIPQDQDMIVLVDFLKPYLFNITEDKLRGFANRFSTFRRSIIWVTPNVSTSCANPNSSMILGMARTLRNEMRKDITVVEIDHQAVTFPSSSRSLVNIYRNLGHRAKSGNVDPDYEFAILGGEIKIPRFHWTTTRQALTECGTYASRKAQGSEVRHHPYGRLPKLIQLQSNACYVLVGGLGGLGRVVATWMVENGARSIMFLSRSAKEGPGTTPFFDELRTLGCEVLPFAGDVTCLLDVEAAMKQTTRPVKGIMQMSAVMRDKPLSKMAFSDWEQSVRPKVLGTWNLHQATSSANLDFFVLLSSICGIAGQPVQANYNSANAFLDAFVNYRHGQNLPASVVDLGLMGCIGMMVREHREVNQRLLANGYLSLGEQDLLDALALAIAYSHPAEDALANKSQISVGLRSTKPMIDPSTRVAWKKDARMAGSHQLEPLGIKSDCEARQRLEMAFKGQKSSS